MYVISPICQTPYAAAYLSHAPAYGGRTECRRPDVTLRTTLYYQLLQIHNEPYMPYALCTCMSRTDAMQMPHIIMNANEAAAVDKRLTPAKYSPTPRRTVYPAD